MRRAASLLLACLFTVGTARLVLAEPTDQGANAQGCNCGGEKSSAESDRLTCLCLFYEYAIYYPPPPSEPLYYYYGMCCNPNWGGTCQYIDVIRRRTGTNRCRVENGTVICPETPPDTSNCYSYLASPSLIQTIQSNRGKKPRPIPNPKLGQIGAKKVPNDQDVVTLTTYPELPGKIAKTHFVNIKAGKETYHLKLQVVELVVPKIRCYPPVTKTVELGVGRQCEKGTENAPLIDSAKISPIPSPGDSEETRYIFVDFGEIVYSVLLEDPYPLNPTPAESQP